MSRNFAGAALLTLTMLIVPLGTARAQYGWGGWGGGGATVGGNRAAGAGYAAAGAGIYNMDTAAARSMNAQTAQQWNDYMYAINQRNSANEMARLQRRQQRTNETLQATYSRLRDNPSPSDIHTGDALNVVLDELVNPKIYTQVVQKSAQPVASALVLNINFQYASKMILLCLEDVHDRVVPDFLKTDPRLETDRQTIRGLVAQLKKESESSNQPSPATLGALRTALTAAQGKADAIWSNGTRQRSEADNFLKGLIGLTRLMERPQVEQFLKGLKNYQTTTLGQLISFMHGFNLRFGPAKTPEQEAAYDQIYPMLVQLRDQGPAAGPGPIAAAQAPLPDARSAAALFSRSSNGAVPAPPAPGRQAVP